MIYHSDITQLIDKWERLANGSTPECASKLRDCIKDLNLLLDNSAMEELSYEDYLAMEADNYYSTLEAHDIAA